MSRSSSSTAVLVAGSALLAAGLGWTYWQSSNSSSSRDQPKYVGDIDELADDLDDDCITADEVAKCFDRLFMELQGVLSQLMQQIQAIQMSGQQIPEAQLQSLLRAEMERALQVKQKIICDDMNMDYDCLEEATWEFLQNETEHAQVKRAVDRFQKLWESTTGEKVAGWRKGQASAAPAIAAADLLEPEPLIAAAQVYFSSLTECMRGIVSEFKAEGKNVQDPAVAQALNLEFANRANAAGEAALQAENLTLEQFEASIKQHSSNPTVGRALGMLQMKQQQELMAIGSS